MADVQAYYDTLTTVETLYGTGIIGGTETFSNNHVVSHPDSITVAVDGQVEFGGTIECSVP